MKIIHVEGKDFERHNFLIKLVRPFVVPLLNSIPSQTIQKIVRKTSPYGTKAIEKTGTTHSLEVMYNKHKFSSFRRGIIKGIADSFWHNIISQPKALRNRLKLVEKSIEEEIVKKIENQEQIKILNIGGGSSRALIHSIDRIYKKGLKPDLKIINIDKDASAIELGKKIVEEFNLENVFTWINDDVRNLNSLIEENSIDIVEMVGLLDYFTNEKSFSLVKQIYRVLKKDGFFIVANVYPNSEMKFVENIGWPTMYYKTEIEMYTILKEAGFSEENLVLIFEPFKVHLIALARK